MHPSIYLPSHLNTHMFRTDGVSATDQEPYLDMVGDTEVVSPPGDLTRCEMLWLHITTLVLLGIPSGWLSGHTPGLSSTEASSGLGVGGAPGLSLVISVSLSLFRLRLPSFLFVSSLFPPFPSLSLLFCWKE